jgi:hypothetical protein
MFLSSIAFAKQVILSVLEFAPLFCETPLSGGGFGEFAESLFFQR